MRDYAKQRPYSIKIRSDSAPSFPDHSNNSLPSKLPPGLQVPSSIPNLPRSNRLLVARPAPTIHGGTTNPCTRNGHPLFQDFAKYNRKNRRDACTCAFTRRLRFSASCIVGLLLPPLMIIESALRVFLF